MQWLYESFLKAVFATGLSGITWIIVDGKMGYTVPFYVIEVVWLLIIFGGFAIIEHKHGDWDIWS
jgi:hypothetical protein